MKILIPMAGAGNRFAEAGYKLSKPAIPTTNIKDGEKVPMVVAATLCIPEAQNSEVIYVDRDFHKQDGIHETIKKIIPKAEFITIDYLTKGQASTCLLAKEYINNNNELFLGACDNGMIMEEDKFSLLKKDSDAIIITHTNDSNIEMNPCAHSWIELRTDEITAKRISIKKPISDTPMYDHATTGMFWFKKGSDFVFLAEKMIDSVDMTGGEYYIDGTMQYAIEEGLRVTIFDVNYICWGTPQDYENYEQTISYWQEYINNEGWI